MLLAEPHHGLAEGVRSLLATAFDTVMIVTDHTSLLDAASRLQPGLAVVDLSFARPDVTTLLRRLRAACPALKIVILGVHDEPTIAETVMAAGADGYVAKRDIAARLLSVVDDVLRSRRSRA